MRNKVELMFAAFLVPLDYCALIAAAVLAYFIRFESSVTDIRPVGYLIPFSEYIELVIPIALAWIPIFAIAGLYRMMGTRTVVDEFRRVFFACSTGILGVIVFIVFVREQFASRFLILAVWGLSVLVVFLARLLVLFFERYLFTKGIGVHRVAVFGDDKSTHELLRSFGERSSLGYCVVNHFPSVTAKALEAMTRSHRRHLLDELILADASIDRSDAATLLAFAEEHHIMFKYSADVFATHAGNISMSTLAGLPMVEVRRTRLAGWGSIVKRLFDIIGASVLIVFLSPVLLVTAIAIKIDSRGFAFWHLDDDTLPERIGQFGEAFPYYKFRSMLPHTHHLRYTKLADRNTRKGGPLVKVEHDPRITRVGSFIRRWSIDELPELFVVLKGDMSLVGPRPHLPEEVERYERHHKRVLTIKPGITGLAQISGRSDLTFEEEVRLDTYYMEHWSILLDLYVLLKTPFAVFGKRAAE